MKRLFRFLPLGIVLGLFGAYVFSNAYFVNCGGDAGCKPIESQNISEVPSAGKHDANTSWKNQTEASDIAAYCSGDANANRVKPDKVADLNCTARVLAEKKSELDEKTKSVESQQALIDRLDEELTENREEQIKKASEANTANANAAPPLEASEKTLIAQKTKRVAIRDEAVKDRQAVTQEIRDIRAQIADRYAKRLVFMFMTAAFILLCLAAIFFSVYVIAGTFGTKSYDADALRKETRRRLWLWQGITAVCAVGFFFLVWCLFRESYLSIVIPMFNQSIAANGDISLGWIHFFNCVGFGTIIMIVGAASAIFYKVVSENAADEKSLKYLNSEKEFIAAKSAAESDEAEKANLTAAKDRIEQQTIVLTMQMKNKYAPYRRNITRILYIGAAMLFVGIVRVKLLADWHLLFVSKDYSALLTRFFENSISVQAAFYSILLAVVFLPVVLAIPSADAGANTPKQNWFEQLGLPITSENIAKFIAVFSPLLATPIVDFLKNFFGIVG